jgi:2,5-diketo-D-gluconate reductase B
VPRDEIFITTKIWPSHFSPPRLERSAEESLARLRVDAVDLLLLHWPSSQVPLSETIGALCKVKRRGLTRQIGISNFTVTLIEEAVRHTTEPLVCDQVEMHPYLDQSKVMAASRRHGIAVVAYSPIARGRAAKDPVLAEIGKVHGKSPTQVCLRWLTQQDVVVIPRTAKVERLSGNAAIFDFTLSAQEMTRIAALAHPGGRVVNMSSAPDWD